MSRAPDGPKSGLAFGYYWTSRITSIGFQAAIPPGLGYWADSIWGATLWKRLGLGNTPVFTVVGAGLGFLAMMLEILKLSRSFESGKRSDKKR